MSLINQVLSDLEKRGAYALPGEPAIRPVAVPQQRRNLLMPVVALLLVLLIAAAWWWNSQRHAAAPVVKAIPLDTASPADSAPSSAVVAPEPQPVAAPVSADAPQQEMANKIGAPSLLLSFELSSIPLPSSLRAKPTTPSPTPNPAPAVTPLISGVSPNPVIASGAAQLLMINGSNFSRGAKVTLRNGGKEYANRPISSVSASQIAIYPNFGKVADIWTVEVLNPGGVSSGTFSFNVQTSASAAGSADKVPVLAKPAAPVSSVDKQLKQVSVQQQADNEFRKANGLMQQGRINDAISGYAAALQLDAGHEAARQAMIGLMLESKRNNDAERVLQEGLKYNPKHSGFAMLLARLQVERNELALALETLRATLPYAGQQADYRAFVAAVLQRQGQHKEAITHYQAALQSAPNSGVWLMGLGISLQAEQRNEEARDAYKRALETRSLNAELQTFVTQRLKGL